MKKLFLFLFLSFIFLNSYSNENLSETKKPNKNLVIRLLEKTIDKARDGRFEHFYVAGYCQLLLEYGWRLKIIAADRDKDMLDMVRLLNMAHLFSAIAMPKYLKKRSNIFLEDIVIALTFVETFLECAGRMR